MKELYVMPSVELVELECEDIILTSNEIDMPGNEQGSDEI